MITGPGYANLLAHLDAITPRVICHPEDEEVVRQAVAASDRSAQIEVTELAEPGQVTIFQGHHWPVADLGIV